MGRDNTLRTLVLTLRYQHRASYYDDWADAFSKSPLFDADIANLMKMSPSRLEATRENYDLIILLHSTISDTLDYLSPLREVLAQRKRPKLLSFVGNEFNSPYVPLSAKTQLLAHCRTDIIATQLLPEAGLHVYAGSAERVISVPHALNPDLFNADTPYEHRPIDVGMRSYRYPPYLGDDDRNRIMDFFSREAKHYGLNVDIDTNHRFSPRDWADFLSRCRTVLATETGSWYLSPSDDLVKEIHAYAQKNRTGLVIPEKSFLRKLARFLPASLKSPLMNVLKKGPVKYGVFEDEKLDYGEIYERFFKNTPRAPVYTKAISSRNFDAIGTRTCQIAFPGRYSDILEPNRHYIPLQPDFSNIDEVVEKLRDEKIWRRIVDEAYDLAMTSHTYRHRAQQVHDAVSAL